MSYMKEEFFRLEDLKELRPPDPDDIDSDYENWLASLRDPEDDE
jgi:hypothetical protein